MSHGSENVHRFNKNITTRNLSHQNQAGIDQREGPGASDPGTAVDHGRTAIPLQRAGLSHLEQEVEERRRRLGNVEIGPCGVVEVIDVSTFSCLRIEHGEPNEYENRVVVDARSHDQAPSRSHDPDNPRTVRRCVCV